MVHGPVLLVMALAPSSSVLLVVCIPRLGGELIAERGEMPGLREIGAVGGVGAAVCVEVVRLDRIVDAGVPVAGRPPGSAGSGV